MCGLKHTSFFLGILNVAFGSRSKIIPIVTSIRQIVQKGYLLNMLKVNLICTMDKGHTKYI